MRTTGNQKGRLEWSSPGVLVQEEEFDEDLKKKRKKKRVLRESQSSSEVSNLERAQSCRKLPSQQEGSLCEHRGRQPLAGIWSILNS